MSAFSLPTQRCFRREASRQLSRFLFSAYAEVFLAAVIFCEPFLFFSLPTQRCFEPLIQIPLDKILFSAYAEVFLN